MQVGLHQLTCVASCCHTIVLFRGAQGWYSLRVFRREVRWRCGHRLHAMLTRELRGHQTGQSVCQVPTGSLR